jgi:drug/metabolite transporter (DMT)-like permease
MGHYFKIFGVILWISGLAFVWYFRSVQTLDSITLSIFALSMIITGFGFLAFGEIIHLLEKNLLQSQALYKLFKQAGGKE